MSNYKCKQCGYIYDHTKGDLEHEIPVGIDFKDLPETWKCPICRADIGEFEEIIENITEIENQTQENIIPKEEKNVSTPKICNSCGAEILEGTIFCGECGAEYKELKEKETEKETETETETETEKETRICSNCGIEVQEGSDFCGKCGVEYKKSKETEKESKICNNCGTEIQEGRSFCGKCGVEYKEPKETEKESRICNNCGTEVQEGTSFCGKCGIEYKESKENEKEIRICSNCGTEIQEGSGFCGKCGTLYQKPQKKKPRFCGICRTEILEGFNFCGKCGAPFGALVISKPSNNVKHCPKCGNEVTVNAEFCGKCGTAMHSQNQIVQTIEKMNPLTYFLLAFKKYATFTGRASKKEYQWFICIVSVMPILLSLLIFIIFWLTSSIRFLIGSLTIVMIWILGTIIPSIAVSVRRMHDVGKPGHYCLIPMYSFMLAATPGEIGENQYGPVPKQ
jgi:rubredoxin/uncharacterized membrane protein YhaH (DUF805 family)